MTDGGELDQVTDARAFTTVPLGATIVLVVAMSVTCPSENFDNGNIRYNSWHGARIWGNSLKSPANREFNGANGREIASSGLDLGGKLREWENERRIAVAERDRDWSYRDFCQHVQHAECYFRHHEIDRVMVCLPQGFYAYAVIWGAYLAGTAFCPTTSGTPRERLDYYANQFKPDLVISEETDQTSVSAAEFFGCTGLPTATDATPIAQNALAYVMFTSGSTGVPKGVMIARQSLENVICWSISEYGASSDDVWGQFSSLGFDLSILDIFTALASGATLIPYQTVGDKLLPAGLIRKKRITIWHSVPSVIDLMRRAQQLDSNTVASLRTVIFCGEKLFPNQLETLFTQNENIVVYNTYGPTEATILCTFVRLTKNNYSRFSENTVSIGAPLPNTEVVLENVTDGIGELVVCGKNVGIGYIEGQEMSGYNRSSSDESHPTPRYYTGDYCRYSAGNLYFECRKDSQVKVLGNRVDLSEIDYQIRCLGCLATTTIYHDSEVVTFVVSDKLSVIDITARLQKTLPAYYIPRRIILMESMPYNANGKVDVRQLLIHLESA